MMEQLIELNSDLTKGVATSLALFAILWTVRIVLCRVVSRKSEILSPDQRRWTRTVRSLVWIILILGLVTIWAPQLHTIALSLAAFVVAIVIATKEVILCFTGAFVRVSTAPFRMGDWITIDTVSGEVVDINPFCAKIQELDVARGTYAFTGRVIYIPNSRYFTVPIENFSHIKQYKSHLFAVAFQSDTVDPAPLVKRLEEIVSRHTEKYYEEAEQVLRRVRRQSSIPLPSVTRQVMLQARDFNNLNFTVRIYVPTRESAAVTSAITAEFMSEVAALRDAAEKKKKK